MPFVMKVYCGKCAIPNENHKVISAVRMVPVYVKEKGRRKVIGYVCPNCGHTDINVFPKNTKREKVKVEKLEYLEHLNIYIPRLPISEGKKK
jgi:hypothetical protein